MIIDVIQSLIDTDVIFETRILELPEKEKERRIKAKQYLIEKELKDAGLGKNG